MYQNNLAVSIKVNNNFIRESAPGIITIPFNSEYSIYIKNLDSRDVKVNIFIDGKNVLDNSSLIISGKKFAELNGFLKGNKIKNRFKFIQKTDESLKENNRNDKIDDGIIRIEYQFTKKINNETTINEHFNYYYDPWYHHLFPRKFDYFPYIRSTLNNTGTYYTTKSYYEKIDNKESFSVNYNNSNGENFSIKSNNVPENFTLLNTNETIKQLSEPKSDEGITVKGSEINEKVKNAWIGELEDKKEVIIIILKGFEVPKSKDAIEQQDGISFKKEIDFNEFIYCSKCGKKIKAKDNFCKYCGTKLKEN